MRIRSYAFGDENDLQRLKTFVTSTISKEMKRSYWHVGDLVWGIYQNTIFDPRENVRLWENDQGSLLGFTWSNFHEIMLQVSPRLDSVEAQELLEQMLTWGKERQEALSTNENAPSFYAIDDDRQLKNLLLKHGYQREGSHILHMRRDLDQPIPRTALPEGWFVSHVKAENEFEQRVALHREVWHPSKVTLESYRRLRTIAGYTPELDLVAISPEGTFASYCICWLDPVSKIGEFEPVGTRSAFRGKGLGKAVMLEGLRRLKASGMQTAIVYSLGSNQASRKLYESVGFEVYNMLYGYV
jgi:mycothiol synthase